MPYCTEHTNTKVPNTYAYIRNGRFYCQKCIDFFNRIAESIKSSNLRRGKNEKPTKINRRSQRLHNRWPDKMVKANA